MSTDKNPHIFVIGNEKGGAGKTTLSMHLIIGLLDMGYKVASIDTDSRQHSLTSYINYRRNHNANHPDEQVEMPLHFYLESNNDELTIEQDFLNSLAKAQNHTGDHTDYIVIDTPGSHTKLSCLAHSYADTVITPINDSFVDIDTIAKINPKTLNIESPSIYSQMLWEQKMVKAKRNQGTIEWVVVRNRLSNLDAQNKRNISDALDKLAKNIAFKIAPGFSERVIFRELFLQGLTLFDLVKVSYKKSFSISHVAARQELRTFFEYLNVKKV